MKSNLETLCVSFQTCSFCEGAQEIPVGGVSEVPGGTKASPCPIDRWQLSSSRNLSGATLILPVCSHCCFKGNSTGKALSGQGKCRPSRRQRALKNAILRSSRTKFSTESKFGTGRESRYSGSKALRKVLGSARFPQDKRQKNGQMAKHYGSSKILRIRAP